MIKHTQIVSLNPTDGNNKVHGGFMIIDVNQRHETVSHEAEALPTAAPKDATPFSLPIIERLGVKHIKQIGRIRLNPSDLTNLEKISDNDCQACVDYLLTLNHDRTKNFINLIQRAAFLSDHVGGEALVTAGASQDHEDFRDVVVEACLKEPKIFDSVVEELISKTPFPKKAYRPYLKKTEARICSVFSPEKRTKLEKTLGDIFKLKKCTTFARTRLQDNRSTIGLMLEHATPVAHYATLNEIGDKLSPDNSPLRLRVTDFIWVDKINNMLWVNSSLLAGKTKIPFLHALGEFFCDDSSAFITLWSPPMKVFDSRDSLESNLKGYNIPGIKQLELREFYYRDLGVTHGNRRQVSGPQDKGCVTEIPDWSRQLPEFWQTCSAHVVYETISGDRESIKVNSRSIGFDHTPNIHLTIALLKFLKLVPNNGN